MTSRNLIKAGAIFAALAVGGFTAGCGSDSNGTEALQQDAIEQAKKAVDSQGGTGSEEIEQAMEAARKQLEEAQKQTGK